jgi:acyl-CoA dehydrogenase
VDHGGIVRSIYNEDHEAFRAVVRKFIESEVVPHYSEWEEAGHPPREFYRRLGELGYLGIQAPVEYGGGGESSFKYRAILTEEAARAAVTLGDSAIHSNIVLPYLLRYATEEQMKRWMPGFVSGEIMTALGITEPGTGSDMAGIQTRATLAPDGTHYILNGAKTFITGGGTADIVLVVARTAPAPTENRRGGLSLLCVETSSEGFRVGRTLKKIGLRASSTVELSFTDVRVPVENRLGEEGEAFTYLTDNLAQERLALALGAWAQADTAVRLATDYAKQRDVFGKQLSTFQNTKFVLAECSTEVYAAQLMIDECLRLLDEEKLTPADGARVKLFCTETASRVIDKCLQIHGGYGYIMDYPIARLYADIRVSRIYAGSSEMMKTIIAKDMGL